MSTEIELVQLFYEVIWNRHDKSAIPSVLHEAFRFRGSLGDEKQDHDGFSGYLDMVHNALKDYKCVINEIVSEPSKAFAKMEFTGIHKGNLMGAPGTGKRLSWNGAALFHFRDGKIYDLWVLGDLKSLESQLHKRSI